ncbi:MAG: sulfatase-like hydrolase/transferase [Planctomycetes bacterium]|nr:sulfatase-like hydrolase/transferase [Planctomycetota bacterium]
MATERPNVVIIFSDQHRPDWMGCSGQAGSRLVRTPNLNALAASGVLFSAACCNAPLCGPSRMSFMTGRHPLLEK